MEQDRYQDTLERFKHIASGKSGGETMVALIIDSPCLMPLGSDYMRPANPFPAFMHLKYASQSIIRIKSYHFAGTVLL